MDIELSTVADAALILREGGLVVFPTETVYGLGANALDARAVEKIFESKGRPADNPLIVHVDTVDRLSLVAAAIDPISFRLLEEFAPGPITVVLPARPDLPRVVTAGLETVAVRIPGHPLALSLLSEAAVPVAAPSANRSGQPSPTSIEMAISSLGDGPAYLDGGPCDIGLESTVLVVVGKEIRILRPGTVTESDILAALPDTEVSAPQPPDASSTDHARLSPGTRHAHYRPAARVLLWRAQEELERLTTDAGHGETVAVIGPASGIRQPADTLAAAYLVFQYQDLNDYARNLYAWFHEADDKGVDLILAHLPHASGIGHALRDRLERSSGS